MDNNSFENNSNNTYGTEYSEYYEQPKESFFKRHKTKILTSLSIVVTAAIFFTIGVLTGPKVQNEASVLFNYSDEKPELDFKTAKKALKDADYDVTLEEDDLPFGVAKQLRADNEDDDGLYIIEYEDEELAKMAFEERLVAIEYYISIYEISIQNIEYVLKEYSTTLTSDEADDYKEELADAKKELKNYEEEFVMGREGCIVWYGTKTAAKDSNDN